MEISDDDDARTEEAVWDRGSGDPHPFARRRLGDASAAVGYSKRYAALGEESGVRLMSNGEEEIIRVAVVDDQRLFAKGISGLVDMLDGVEVVGVAHDGEEGVALCRKEEPDVVLMDISMPKMDGISATREIRDLLPQTAVIILTAHEDDEHVFEGIKAGAQGYLLKDSEPEDLSRAIRTVHAGDTIIAPELAQKMLSTFESGGPRGSRLAPPLTERELEVIRALAQGMSDRQIARSLDISEKTVRNHTSNIYRKLHIFDRTQAVIYAVREGVIDVEELEYRPPREP
jgi:DNA-binding NarL/FixJ family response regulator